MGKTKEHIDCDCIFCNSKCPECGSENIQVSFRPRYRFLNSNKNCITVTCKFYNGEIKCFECKAFLASRPVRSAKHLDKLTKQLLKVLDLPLKTRIKIEDNGEVTIGMSTPTYAAGRKISLEDLKG